MCVCCKGKAISRLFAFWVYFLAMILPVTGIIQHGMIAMGGDRYMSLPMIGVAVVVSFIHFNYADDSHEAANENQQRDETLGEPYSPNPFHFKNIEGLNHYSGCDPLWRDHKKTDPHMAKRCDGMGA